MSQDVPSRTKTRFRRSRRRVLAWAMVVFMVLLSGAGGSALWLQGRELVAPPWLRDQIATQLTKVLPDVDIAFGDVVAVLESDWRPRFFVRDLQVNTLTGVEIISIADASASIDKAALMQRQISLTALDANGVIVTMRRTSDGAIALSAGAQAGGVTRQAPTLVQLVTDLGDVLTRPTLVALQSVDVRAVTLRYEDLRAGRAWTADGGRMRLSREGHEFQIAVDLAILGGAAQVATLAANYSGVIGAPTSDFGITIRNLEARDIASQGPAFAWLAALQAPISGALRGGVASDGVINPLSATLQIGEGVIQPTPEASPIPINGARSYLSYIPEEELLRFDELSVDSKWGSGRLEGQAQLHGIQNGKIADLVGQFRLTSLKVNPDNLYPEPVLFDAAELDVRLALAPFELDIGRFQLSDQGQMLSAQGRVAAGVGGWDIAMDAQMDGLSAPRLIALWPERIKEKTRNWIAENVYDGTVSEANAALRIVQGGTPEVYLGFDFEQANFRFTKDLPPVERAKGHASLFQDRFVIILDEGGLTAPEGGGVNAAGTSFIVPDTRAKPDPPGIVRLIAEGSVTAALSLLDQPPLEVMQKANIPVSVAEGQIELAGTLALTLKKKLDAKEISFDMRGTALDVRSDQLVKDRLIKSPTLSIEASETGVSVAGKATLDAVPLDVVWRQPLGAPGESPPGELTGQVEITQDALEAFGVSLPPGTLRGTGAGDVSLTLAKGTPPKLRLTSDLRGLAMSVPPIGWSKPASAEGAFALDMTLGEAPRIDRITIDALGLSADGEINLTPDQQLERVRLNRVKVGGWLDAPVDLVGQGAGQPLAIVVRGGTVDMRRADLPARETGGSASGPLTVALDKLQISDTIALTDMQGKFSTNNGLTGPFSGLVNGGSPVTGQISPQNNRSAIRLKAANAGRTLASAGLVEQLRDGQMELVLVPVGSGGAFDGKLNIKDSKITDAPAMADLLNAISVVGLINELNGDGIFFSEIAADFRLAPARITLREASAVGASMGLSMDGFFEPDTGRVQLQGVISPIYLLNAIGSVLTRPGEGLFGFNYSITGTAKNPDVFVNPLTALAPGMFRNLFRSAQPDVPLEDGEPVPVPEPRRVPVVTRGEDR